MSCLRLRSHGWACFQRDSCRKRFRAGPAICQGAGECAQNKIRVKTLLPLSCLSLQISVACGESGRDRMANFADQLSCFHSPILHLFLALLPALFLSAHCLAALRVSPPPGSLTQIREYFLSHFICSLSSSSSVTHVPV